MPVRYPVEPMTAVCFYSRDGVDGRSVRAIRLVTLFDVRTLPARIVNVNCGSNVLVARTSPAVALRALDSRQIGGSRQAADFESHRSYERCRAHAVARVASNRLGLSRVGCDVVPPSVFVGAWRSCLQATIATAQSA